MAEPPRSSSTQMSSEPYESLVKYEEGTCHCTSLKVMLLVVALIGMCCLIYGSLAVHGSIVPALSWEMPLAFVGAGFSILSLIFLISAWKSAYNDMYHPRANWGDFLRRDWNDFLGDNYEYYKIWKSTSVPGIPQSETEVQRIEKKYKEFEEGNERIRQLEQEAVTRHGPQIEQIMKENERRHRENKGKRNQ